jgi:hypothetical protein
MAPQKSYGYQNEKIVVFCRFSLLLAARAGSSKDKIPICRFAGERPLDRRAGRLLEHFPFWNCRCVNLSH